MEPVVPFAFDPVYNFLTVSVQDVTADSAIEGVCLQSLILDRGVGLYDVDHRLFLGLAGCSSNICALRYDTLYACKKIQSFTY